MSKEVWEKLLAAIEVLNRRSESLGAGTPTDVLVWHGGEPMALPLSYLQELVNLQHEVFPPEWFENGRIKNRMQSNLFSISESKIDFLKRNRFGVGASFDVIGGARVDVRGNETESRVIENIRRLERHGIKVSTLVVVAGHTARQIDLVYKFLRDRGAPCRLLPLFDGPTDRPIGDVAIDREHVNSALIRMFKCWFEDGCKVRIKLFDEYLDVVVKKILGLKTDLTWNRRVNGDRIFIVNIDGTLFTPYRCYEERFMLGDLRESGIIEILNSSSYLRGLDDDDAIRAEVCEKCDYYQACGSKEMFMITDGGAKARECMTAKPLFGAIETYLRSQGISESTLSELLLGSN